MVRAWLMCSPVINQSAPCNCEPPVDVSVDELHNLGILTQYIPVVDKNGLIDKMCAERGYVTRDEMIISRDKVPDYDEEASEIKKYFEEHMHIDEEVRYVLDGSGYYDVRNQNDKWVRINLEPGDTIILPPGIFHRFTPDQRDYLHMLRLFKADEAWVALNRTELAKVIKVREEYLKKYVEK